MVECNLAKVDVEGSNPFSRSTRSLLAARHEIEHGVHDAKWLELEA